MKLGIAIWNGRVSPVFDTSQRLDVLDVEDGQVRSRQEEEIAADDPGRKAGRLDELGVTTLICGAVSRSLAELLAARGIHVLPFVCGGTEEVLSAFLAGRLPDPSLAMPGCCGRRRNRFGAVGRCGSEDEETPAPATPACQPGGQYAARRVGGACLRRRGMG